LYHFFIFWKTEKAVQGGVAGENFKKLTRSSWAMWCATGKFSKFEKFTAD
jgi:hypothetical protein